MYRARVDLPVFAGPMINKTNPGMKEENDLCLSLQY